MVDIPKNNMYYRSSGKEFETKALIRLDVIELKKKNTKRELTFDLASRNCTLYSTEKFYHSRFNFSLKSSDSRVPGLPGCRVRHFTGFFARRLYMLDKVFG